MLLGILKNLSGAGENCGEVSAPLWVGAGTVGLWCPAGPGAAEFVIKCGYVIPCLFQTVMLVLEIDRYLRK